MSCNSSEDGPNINSKTVFSSPLLLLDSGLDYPCPRDYKEAKSKRKKKAETVTYSSRRLLAMGILIFAVMGLLDASSRQEEENTARNLSLLNLLQNTEILHEKLPSPKDNHNRYCSNVTAFFHLPDIERAVDANRFFHTQGGNLKGVQKLLDNNIDTTIQKIGATFIPNDEKVTETQQVTEYLEQHFQENYDPRGGYGRPLPGKYKPTDHPLILEGRYVQVTEPINSRERWDASLGPTGPQCNNLLQLGKSGRHGTKWFCQPESVQIEQNFTSDCHVISIGGNDNWDFESHVVEEMKNCHTHTFDCTLPGGQPKHKPRRNDIHFYPYCINDRSYVDEHGREYLTYFDIIAKANLTGPPKLFKMDVEGFEFDIFTHMIQQANQQPTSEEEEEEEDYSFWLPQQMQVELHWATRMRGVAWMARTRTTAELALLSGMMFTGGGYMPIFQNWDKGCPSCMEVLYFRLLC